MFARTNNTSPASPDVHPSWCPCLECATDWDAAHCGLRRLSSTFYGLLIGGVVIGAIVLFIGVPA